MEYHLKTPITREEVLKLRSGDTVYISGTVITLRDDGHKRYTEEKERPGISLEGIPVYHCGPIMKRTAGGYEALSAGPTTSMRMEKYEADFIRRSGTTFIIGKGGMGPKTQEACVRYGAVHGIFPGGCAAVAASCIKETQQVIWEDLGMPEAMWVLRVEEFGPVLVNIDARGGDYMSAKMKEYKENDAKAQGKG